MEGKIDNEKVVQQCNVYITGVSVVLEISSKMLSCMNSYITGSISILFWSFEKHESNPQICTLDFLFFLIIFCLKNAKGQNHPQNVKGYILRIYRGQKVSSSLSRCLKKRFQLFDKYNTSEQTRKTRGFINQFFSDID